jgi:PAS domain S-box-containing protein
MIRMSEHIDEHAVARRAASGSTAARRRKRDRGLLEGLLAHSLDGITLSDRASRRFLEVSQSFCALTGYSPGELIGRTATEVGLVGDDPQRAAVIAGADRGRGGLYEVEIRCKDGALRSVELSIQMLECNELALTIIRDVTERRALESQLRDSRERLAEAERIAGIGSWQQDLSDGSVTFSDGMLEIHALSADQFDGTSDAAQALVDPDDQAHVYQTLGRAIAERSSYTIDYRVIRSDGRVRNLRGHGDVVVDGNGLPLRVIGVVQDITDAKLTQEALQSTSAELGRRANELQRLALHTANEPPDTPHTPLSARQLEILQLIAEGLTNAAIGERLVLTEGTIKWHVQQILAKTNTRNRAEAIARVLGTPQ